MIHPDLERVHRILDRDKAERNLIDKLVEQFLEESELKDYVGMCLKGYELDFDIEGAMTEDHMELVCQYQNLIYVQIVAGMLRKLTGRN